MKEDTPTTGSITISADASFAPLVNDEINGFEALYQKATIKAAFKSEADAVTDLLNDRVKVIIISRKLKQDELTYFDENSTPSQVQIGLDGVAFILNRENSDSNFTYDQVLDLLSGKIADWKQINPSSTLGKPALIFDNSRSGIFRYIKEDILKSEAFNANAFALTSNDSVFRYVQKDSSAIGIIGVSWISGLGDTMAQNLLGRISVAGITSPDSLTNKAFYRPYREQLMRREYPFLRPIYIISREKYAGLGTGFASYAASDEGQTIVERSGLIPVVQPQRVIMLRNEF